MDPCPACSPNTYFTGHRGLCAFVRDDEAHANLLARIRRTYRRLMKIEPDQSKSIGDLKYEMDTQLAGDGAEHGAERGDEKDKDYESPSKRRRITPITPTPDKAKEMKAYMMKSMEDMLMKQKDALLKILATNTEALIANTADHVPKEFEDWRKVLVNRMNVNHGQCYKEVNDALNNYITEVLPMM